MKKRDKKQLLPGIVVAVAISFLVFFICTGRLVLQ